MLGAVLAVGVALGALMFTGLAQVRADMLTMEQRLREDMQTMEGRLRQDTRELRATWASFENASPIWRGVWAEGGLSPTSI